MKPWNKKAVFTESFSSYKRPTAGVGRRLNCSKVEKKAQKQRQLITTGEKGVMEQTEGVRPRGKRGCKHPGSYSEIKGR